jgi:hypothetical protein
MQKKFCSFWSEVKVRTCKSEFKNIEDNLAILFSGKKIKLHNSSISLFSH